MKGKILLLILGLSVFSQAVSGQKKLTFDNVYIDETETLFLQSRNKLIKILSPSGDKQNPRFSPNGLYMAFTISGNLAVYDIRKEYVRLATRDGNLEVLNGYASWVYYEEILGRNTENRAFWLKYLLGKEISE